jgi:hypothetical protein
MLRLGIDARPAEDGGNRVVRSLDQVRAKSRKADEAIRGTESSFDRMKRSAVELTDPLHKVRNILGMIGLGIGAAQVVRFFWETNTAAQSLAAQLRVLEGANAGAVFNQIEQYAVKTPFQIEAITEAFVRFRGAGIQMSEDVMTAFGDIVATKPEKTIKDFAMAVEDAVSGSGFERLKEYGVTLRKEGDQLAGIFRGQRTTFANSAQGIQEYLVAVGNLQGVQGSMAEQMGTLNGGVSNLFDALSTLARTIGGEGGVNTEMGSMIGRFTDGVSAISQNTGAIAKWTAVAIAGAKAVAQTVAYPVKVFFNYGQIIGNFFDMLAHGVLEAVQSMANDVINVLNWAIGQANRIPGVGIGLFGTLDADIARTRAAAARAWSDMRGNADDLGAALRDLGESYRGVWDAAQSPAAAAVAKDMNWGGGTGAGGALGGTDTKGKKAKTAAQIMGAGAAASLTVLNDLQRRGESFGAVWDSVLGILGNVEAQIRKLGDSAKSAEWRELRSMIQGKLFGGLSVPDVDTTLAATGKTPDHLSWRHWNGGPRGYEGPGETNRPGSIFGGNLLEKGAFGAADAASAAPGKVLNGLAGGAMKLLSAFNPLAIMASIISSAFEAVGPQMEPLMNAVAKVAAIFVEALLPVLEALWPVFKLTAIAATYVGQVFFNVAGGIMTAVGWLIKAIGEVVDKLLPGKQDGLQKVGQGMMDVGRGFIEGAAALGNARDKIKELNWDDVNKASKDTAAAITDISKAINLALYRSRIGSGVPLDNPRGPGTVPTLPERPQLPHGGGGGGFVVHGGVQIVNEAGDSGEDLLRKMERAAADRVAQGGYVLMPSGAW